MIMIAMIPVMMQIVLSAVAVGLGVTVASGVGEVDEVVEREGV